MLRVSRLLELALHQYFAERAPRFQDYAELAPVLLALKRAGTPVVVAPHWAEPLVRQAAPAAFPIGELARADDSGFASFLEVSLLGQSAAELSAFPVLQTRQVGPFRISLRQNPRPEPVSFDFVTAVESGDVEVFVEVDQQLTECPRVEHARASTGGLHGHVAYPRVRHECGGGRFVGVTLVEDQAYHPHRCILAEPPDGGSFVLRFTSVPASRRLLGFAGFSYFLERDVTADEVELHVDEGGAELGQYRVSGARGWSRFELTRGPGGPVEVHVRRLLRKAGDVCFALEAW
jgi:hypothetical protein